MKLFDNAISGKMCFLAALVCGASFAFAEEQAASLADLKTRYVDGRFSYVVSVENTMNGRLKGRVCVRLYDADKFEVESLLGDEVNIGKAQREDATGERRIETKVMGDVASVKAYFAKFGCANDPSEAISNIIEAEIGDDESRSETSPSTVGEQAINDPEKKRKQDAEIRARAAEEWKKQWAEKQKATDSSGGEQLSGGEIASSGQSTAATSSMSGGSKSGPVNAEVERAAALFLASMVYKNLNCAAIQSPKERSKYSDAYLKRVSVIGDRIMEKLDYTSKSDQVSSEFKAAFTYFLTKMMDSPAGSNIVVGGIEVKFDCGVPDHLAALEEAFRGFEKLDSTATR